ncbi:hypothetical protein GCM10007939_01940 [Amylibacter marinus]|uniref:Uncharacterized protein n=1 Tax=Amylibacter marinus TaxID=1475483 RepID=A0ABQ5VRL1_9RHOB|nr:hypothetical protein [Amylibacter marinus]GLQ33911.1 hypothetical protein GCM10007939_01940 [Amylibacter marinus]
MRTLAMIVGLAVACWGAGTIGKEVKATGPTVENFRLAQQEGGDMDEVHHP